MDHHQTWCIKLDNVCWHNLSATFNNQPDLIKHFRVMALIYCALCVFNIIRWIIIKLGGNVCWLNPLAKFNNQPDPMKFSGVMTLELTQILNMSTLSAPKLKTVFIVCGYNILPKFVNQLIASNIQIIQIDSRHLLSYYMPISLVYYYTGVFCDIWTLLF